MQNLNLKINKLDDKSGTRLFQDIKSNSTLEILDLSSNNLGYNVIILKFYGFSQYLLISNLVI